MIKTSKASSCHDVKILQRKKSCLCALFRVKILLLLQSNQTNCQNLNLGPGFVRLDCLEIYRLYWDSIVSVFWTNPKQLLPGGELYPGVLWQKLSHLLGDDGYSLVRGAHHSGSVSWLSWLLSLVISLFFSIPCVDLKNFIAEMRSSALLNLVTTPSKFWQRQVSFNKYHDQYNNMNTEKNIILAL